MRKQKAINQLVIFGLFACAFNLISPQQGTCQQATIQKQVTKTTPQPSKAVFYLSLDDALKIALTEGNRIKLAEHDITKARYDKRNVIAKLFPTIDATGDYNITLKKQVMYLGGGMKFPGMPKGAEQKGIEVGRRYNVTGGISAGMPLVNLPLWQSIELSQKGVELSILKSEESKASLYTQVVKAFYGVLLATETYHVVNQSYTNAVANYKNISARYEQGVVAEFDKIRAEVQVTNLEPSLEQAKNSISQAKRQLLLLLSMDVTTPIECKGSLENVEPSAVEIVPSNDSLNNNHQLLSLNKQIDLLNTQKKLANSAFVPTVSMGFFYRVSGLGDAFNWNSYRWTPFSAIQVTLSIPIFHGLERINNTKIAQLNINKAELQRNELYNSLQAQQSTYNENITTALHKYYACKRAIAQAERGYQIAEKRYEVGSSTLIELNDANIALAQTRLNYLQALYEYIVNNTELKQLQGTIPLGNYSISNTEPRN